MAEKRKQLGARMSSNYKAGPQGALELLLSSASFEELTSNIYYLDKISESDKKMIADVKALRDSLPFIGGESERDATYILNFFKCQPALNYGFAHTR